MRALVLIILTALPALTANIVGTLVEIKAESLEVVIQPDQGAPNNYTLAPDTLIQRIAPGQKDLKQAETLPATSLAKGDRVLASVGPDGRSLRRLVVMNATDIAKRHEAEREDWTKRGVMGRATALHAGEVSLALRGEHKIAITVTPSTKIRRYLPDSVKFADAREAVLHEIKNGDQVRARGEKNADGKQLAAEEIVFGTFATKAGEVVSVDEAGRSLRIKETGSGKTITVKVSGYAQLKRMPDFAAMMAGRGGAGGGMPPGGMPGMMGGGPPDPAQMIERMPPGKFEDFKAGETIVISSTVGTRADELNAITVLGNAGMLLQMMSMQAMQRGGGPGGGAPGGMPPMGMMMDLPGMMP